MGSAPTGIYAEAATNSSRSSSTLTSTGGISPTPLAQAAFDSVSGTPKSAPDRPYAELFEKLTEVDTRLTTTLEAAALEATLAKADGEIAELKSKVTKLEHEAQTNAATSAKRIEELTEAARSASATAAERERIIQFLHQQQATVWHAFLASTNTNAATVAIPPFPAAPAP